MDDKIYSLQSLVEFFILIPFKISFEINLLDHTKTIYHFKFNFYYYLYKTICQSMFLYNMRLTHKLKIDNLKFVQLLIYHHNLSSTKHRVLSMILKYIPLQSMNPFFHFLTFIFC